MLLLGRAAAPFAGRAVAAAPSAAVAAGRRPRAPPRRAPSPPRRRRPPPAGAARRRVRASARPRAPGAGGRRRRAGASPRAPPRAARAAPSRRCRRRVAAPSRRAPPASTMRSPSRSAPAPVVITCVALGEAAEDLDDRRLLGADLRRPGTPPSRSAAGTRRAGRRDRRPRWRDDERVLLACRVVMLTRAYMPGFSRTSGSESRSRSAPCASPDRAPARRARCVP